MTEQAPEWPAIVLRGLSKRFGHTVAVNGLHLDVPRGSFFGLLGPNGAGKTTTLKMLSGLLRPDAGQAWVDGIDVWQHPVDAKRRVGVLPESAQLFERLTGRELLTYAGLLRGLPPRVVDQRAYELAGVLGLLPHGGTLVVDYSYGMRKKIGLACALIHAPRVLVLDEPLEGIDPVSGRAIRAVLDDYTASGGTVVFSSHVMEVVEKLCDRVAVMHEGVIRATGTVAELSGDGTLEEAFVRIVGTPARPGGELSWLSS